MWSQLQATWQADMLESVTGCGQEVYGPKHIFSKPQINQRMTE